MKKQEQGTCPLCGANNLEYEAADFEIDVIMFPWTCKNCGTQGHECYDMTFIEHENITKNTKE